MWYRKAKNNIQSFSNTDPEELRNHEFHQEAPEQDFYLKHQDIPLNEPSSQQRLSTGVIMREPDGRIWVVEPSNHYGGYSAVFPKGRQEPHLTGQQNALKEAWEESGLHADIDDYLGDFVGNTSTTRYYTGTRKGGSPYLHGHETQAVHLMDVPTAKDTFMNQKKGMPIQALEAYEKWLKQKRNV